MSKIFARFILVSTAALVFSILWASATSAQTPTPTNTHPPGCGTIVVVTSTPTKTPSPTPSATPSATPTRTPTATNTTCGPIFVTATPTMTPTRTNTPRPTVAGDLGFGSVHGVVTNSSNGAPIAGALITCTHTSFTSPALC